jgi:hypothetical protein
MRGTFKIGTLLKVLISLLIVGCGSGEGGERSPMVANGQPEAGFRSVGMLTLDGDPQCTGTLISRRRVLLAAHCVNLTNGLVNAERLAFVLGPSLDQPEHILPVKQVYAHPEYFGPRFMENDVAVLILTTDAPYSMQDDGMQLAERVGPELVGEQAVFVGYGVTDSYTKEGAGIKRSGAQLVDAMDDWRIQLRATAGKAGTCEGDSGGPLFVADQPDRYTLVGTTSYGNACSKTIPKVMVFTRADRYRGFIENPQSKSPPTERPCKSVEGCNGNDVQQCLSRKSLLLDRELELTSCSDINLICMITGTGMPACCPDQETADGYCDGNTFVTCVPSGVFRQDCVNGCGEIFPGWSTQVGCL